jgi:hypothetical protein
VKIPFANFDLASVYKFFWSNSSVQILLIKFFCTNSSDQILLYKFLRFLILDLIGVMSIDRFPWGFSIVLQWICMGPSSASIQGAGTAFDVSRFDIVESDDTRELRSVVSRNEWMWPNGG